MRPLERARTDGFDLERRYAQRYNQLDAATGQIHQQAMRGRLDQYRRARLVNSISPGFAFQFALEGITANGIQRFEQLAGLIEKDLLHFRIKISLIVIPRNDRPPVHCGRRCLKRLNDDDVIRRHAGSRRLAE